LRAVVELGWRWGAKAGFSLIDQALVSGASFALSILLAIWLSPEEFGGFSVAFAVFLFVSGFHNALILEPMSVLGPAHHSHALRDYVGKAILLNFAVSAVLSACLALGAALLGDPLTRQQMLGLSLALPWMLLFWTIRRAYYLETLPARASFASATYFAVQVGTLWALWRFGWLTPLTTFVPTAAASILACVVPFRVAPHVRLPHLRLAIPAVRPILREHWDYGKWIVLVAICSGLALHVQPVMAAVILGLETAGILRAMQLFTLPIVQVATAMSVLALPVVAADFGRGDRIRARQKGLTLTAVLAATACAYEFLLLMAGGTLSDLVFGDKYAAHSQLIPILGVAAVCGALTTGFSTLLRAAQRPITLVLTTGMSGVVGLLSAYGLTLAWGVIGTAISVVLSAVVSMAITVYLCQGMVRDTWAGSGLRENDLADRGAIRWSDAETRLRDSKRHAATSP
jgi:O-antigen/teichoic acid export membrane protein